MDALLKTQTLFLESFWKLAQEEPTLEVESDANTIWVRLNKKSEQFGWVEPVGEIELREFAPGEWFVFAVGLDESLIGQGKGSQLYRAAIDELKRKKGEFLVAGKEIGYTTSPEAEKVWERLCNEFGCPPGQLRIDLREQKQVA